ncbi:MAG TPA: GNAT family N-acetyltransferase [Actinocrinis sp.]|nr:GNAT family N-acetyltransferase [Actinocrinis sp.]
MTFRPVVESDLDRVLPLIAADPLRAMTPDLFQARLRSGEYRLDRTWIAEDGRTGPDHAEGESAAPPLAVAVWWGHPGSAEPQALDCVLVLDEPGASDLTTYPDSAACLVADLLTAAHATFAACAASADPPDWHLLLPPAWREEPAVAAALEWRIEAARRVGLSESVERLRYEWTSAVGISKQSGRLRFRAEPDDEVFVDLFRRVLPDTLDAASGNAAAKFGAEAQARSDVAFYRDQMSGERSWWRVVQTSDGTPVGFGLPSRNPESPVVGYLGVLPEHRGHGYSAEILAEITRFLAVEAGAQHIDADTDLTNVPMAAAFERVGYRNNGRRLVLSAQ